MVKLSDKKKLQNKEIEKKKSVIEDNDISHAEHVKKNVKTDASSG